MMDLVNQFIENYKKKFTFYETAGKLAAAQLEDALQAAGIRAIVTSRAKAPGRLKSKVFRRNAKRETPYKNMKEIYEDIVDLSGVRVSLYFPGDRDKTDKLIGDLFHVLEIRRFPEQSETPTYNKRFSGYWASHYRVELKEDVLEEPQKKYVKARIEIQVASLLMHAWSEVEHDLVYKPLQGTLSEEEFAIIDELNGLMLTGEIALERLQIAGNQRILSKKANFSSQYDLAAYLYDYLSHNFRKEEVELRMGNVELLFRLISALEMNNVKTMDPVIKSVKFEKDRRNISQQIIDQIITGSRRRYQAYQELRNPEFIAESEKQNAEAAADPSVASAASTADPAALVGAFFREWVPLENFLNRLTYKNSRVRGAFNINSLKRMNLLDTECLDQIVSLRTLRNVLIHEIELPDTEEIKKQTEKAKILLDRLPALVKESEKKLS